MNKSKKSKNKIVKFIRETAVVVIGVAITLSASFLITKSNEKRDIHLYLNAIKMELEENTKILNEATEYFKPLVSYSAYLRSHDKKSLNKDSLNNYIHACYWVQSFVFKTNAFEMFKSSGMMRLMNNKELLMAIWDVYTELFVLKNEYDEHEKRRWNYSEKEIPLFVFDKGQMIYDFIPMYDFFKLDYTKGMLSMSEQALKEIEKVQLKLEETKTIK